MNGLGFTGTYPAARLAARVSGNHDQGRPIGRAYRYGYAPAWARAKLPEVIEDNLPESA